jgi:EAL domain-containing protein (putative c-di-GMP-specific phosphodiesterase class I)
VRPHFRALGHIRGTQTDGLMPSPLHSGKTSSFEPTPVGRDATPQHISPVVEPWADSARDLHARLRHLVGVGQPFDRAVIDIYESKEWTGRARSSDAPYIKKAITEHWNSILDSGEEIFRTDDSRFFFIRTDALDKSEVRCQKLLTCVRLPIVPKPGRTITPQAECGLLRVECEWSVATIIERAATALLAAREEGGGRIVRYGGGVEEISRLRERLAEDLPGALRSGQISINLQPIVCLDTGAVVAGEAFPRWSHPVLGTIASADFLEIARIQGLSADIDRKVVQEVVEYLRNISELEQSIPIWINVSEEFLKEAYLPERVRDWCQAAGVPPLLLGFEISESLALKNEPMALGLLKDLRDLGIRLGIDDFGRNQIPLSVVLGLGLSSIKCRMSWLRERFGDLRARATLASLVHIGHGMGCSVGATQVEADSDLAWLRVSRFDFAQGFGCIRPISMDKFRSIVRERAVAPPKISPFSI